MIQSFEFGGLYALRMNEFDAIKQYFSRPTIRAALSGGDDCALLNPTPGTQLVISSDMLVVGRHFFADVNPHALGHKALAVNLSDLAACGATPVAFTLALSLPHIDGAWLQAFAEGMYALASAHGCELVGGDTTRGALNICITVFGEVPRGQALLRSGAKVGDDIYVSGTLGDARLALDALQGHIALPHDVLAAARLRLEQPTPRVALGAALRGIATSAIDISDGLAGDLGHVLKASGVGARVDAEVTINLIAACACIDWATVQFDSKTRLKMAFSGGDDYELAFTAPASAKGAVQAAAARSHTPVTLIGVIEAEPGLRLFDGNGQAITTPFASFDHFAQ